MASFSGQDTTQLTGNATITWGDGNQSAGTITTTGPDSFTVAGTNTYLEEGLYNLTVTVGLTSGGPLVGGGMAQVADAALSGTGTNVTAIQDVPTGLVQVADFTDDDPGGTLTDYTASIQWGDGTSSSGLVQSDGNGGYEVLGDHTYLTAGSFTITTTIADSGGSSVVVTSTTQAPNPSATGIGILEGQVFNFYLPLALPLSPGQEPPASFTAAINWGDGTTSPVSAEGEYKVVNGALTGQILVTGDHIYTEDGVYTLSLVVTGSDGNIYTPNGLPFVETLYVADAPLTAGVVSLQAVATSLPAAPVPVADFFDGNIYGSAADFSASINWGDGNNSGGTVVSLGGGHFEVVGAHDYADSGTDTVSVTVNEDNPLGSSVTITGLVNVLAPWTAIPDTTGTRGDDPDRAGLLNFGEATVDPNLGALRLSQPLDFDQSPGTDVGGNPALVYNSATVDVQPVVQIGLAGVEGELPTQVAVQLTWNGVQQGTQYFYPTGDPSEEYYLLPVQVQGPVTASGAYAWSATITITLPGNQIEQTTTSGVSYVVARDNSPYGSGWGIDGIDQLVATTGGVLFVTGQGDSRFFASNGDGTFTSPPEDFGTLVQNGDGTYTYTAKDQTKENFNAQGLMTSFVDTHGLATTYAYNAEGGLTQVNSIDGGVTLLGYDPTSGLLDSITEPGDRILTFAHDANGDLTGVTDADGNLRTLTYDGAHHVIADQWSPLDATFSYDPTSGQLTQVNLGLGTTYTLVSAASGVDVNAEGQAFATVTDGMNYTTAYVLDMRGRQLAMEDAMGNITAELLDAAGQVTREVDAMGRPTWNSYSSAGDLLQVTNADGSWTQYQYDPVFHEVTQTLDSSGEKTTDAYNSTGDLVQSIDATGAVTSYVWANGLLLSETDPGEIGPETTTYYYDTARREIASLDPMGDASFTGYNAAGDVAETWDALGNETQFITDGNGQVIETIAANGAITSETYNAYGEVTSSTDARGLTSYTTYDQRGWDIKYTDPTGAYTQTIYNADGDITETLDADLHPTYYFYDADNRQTSAVDAMGRGSSNIYDLDGEVLSSTDALGNITTDTYNVMGEDVLSTDPMGYTESDVYDTNGNVVASLGAQGWTLTGYDLDNRVISTTTPGGEERYTTYDLAGEVVATTDTAGHATFYTYDADNRQIAEKDADGHSTETVYNVLGEVVGSIDARGYETIYYYDTVGEQIGSLDPTGDLSQAWYDADGNVIASIDPRGHASIDMYDADNRVIADRNADGFWSFMGYDPAGNETVSIDDNGHSSYTLYDADNEAIITVDADGHAQQTVYNADAEVVASFDGDHHGSFMADDADGEQVSQSDADGNVTSTPTDAAGQLAEEIDPDGNTWVYCYDANGNMVASFTQTADDPHLSETLKVYDADNRLVSSTDADGRTITDVYDNVGNLLKETWYNATGQVTDTQTYTYDQDGNVLTAANTQGQYTYTYDTDDRVQSQTDPWGLTLTYGYDQNGNVVSVQDSLGGVLGSTYDADNQLLTRTFSGTGQTTMRLDLTYTPDGQTSTETYYSDLYGQHEIGAATYGYDPAGNLTSLVDTNGSGTVIASYGYSYDPANLLLSENDSGTITDYTYDPAGQLLSAGSQAQTYDANGNRTDTGYVTGAGNELLSDGTWNYTYDAEGNLIQKTGISNGITWTYSYDDYDRLISATETGSQSASETLSYDVYGQLIQQITSTGGTTRYAYDQNGNAWADLSGSGALVMRRLYLDGQNQVYARIAADGTLAVYDTDHLGSVRDILDASGNVIDAKSYDAWGNLVSESNASAGDRFGWAGLVFDFTTGLDRADWRDYDPTTARWIAQDQSGFGAGQANLYVYAGNNAVGATDPTGLEAVPLLPTVDQGLHLAAARRELSTLVPKTITSEDAKFRFLVLYSLTTCPIAEPTKKDERGVIHEELDPKLWNNDGSPKGDIGRMINALWSNQYHNSIWCNVTSRLDVIRASYLMAGNDPAARAKVDAAAKVYFDPKSKDNPFLENCSSCAGPGGFQAADLIPGDQIYIDNPYYFLAYAIKDGTRWNGKYFTPGIYAGEEGSNLYYFGGGRVMNIYGYPEHAILTIDRKKQSMTGGHWHSSAAMDRAYNAATDKDAFYQMVFDKLKTKMGKDNPFKSADDIKDLFPVSASKFPIEGRRVPIYPGGK